MVERIVFSNHISVNLLSKTIMCITWIKQISDYEILNSIISFVPENNFIISTVPDSLRTRILDMKERRY